MNLDNPFSDLPFGVDPTAPGALVVLPSWASGLAFHILAGLDAWTVQSTLPDGHMDAFMGHLMRAFGVA